MDVEVGICTVIVAVGNGVLVDVEVGCTVAVAVGSDVFVGVNVGGGSVAVAVGNGVLVGVKVGGGSVAVNRCRIIRQRFFLYLQEG